MKKLVSILLMAFLLVGLVGCSSSKNNTSSNTGTNTGSNTSSNTAGSSNAGGIQTTIDKPVTIEFWHAMSGNLEKALTKMTNDFNSSHPNITVKLVNQGSYGDLSKKLMAAAKSHQSPVIAQAYEDWMQQYIQNGLITDLTPYENDKKYGWTSAEKQDIVKVFRDENTFNNKLYGVPFNKSTEVLFYNTDYFKAKNLQVPTTWDQWQADAKALTTTINGKKVVGMGFENSIGLNFPTYVLQAGGQFVDTTNNKIMLDSAAGKKAINFLDGMIKAGTAKVADPGTYMSDPFGNGDIAMYIGSSAGLPFVASAAKGKVNWATAPLPKDKQAATQFQGTNIVLFNSANDQQKLAAWEYMKFMSSKAETIYWAQQTGYVPVRTSALDDSSWKQYVQDNPNYAAAEKQFDAGYYYPHIPGSNEVKNAISKDITDVLVGGKPADAGLTKAAKDAQAAIDKASGK